MDRNIPESELLKNAELPSQLEDLLPSGYSYRLKKWTPYGNELNHFEAIILTNVYTGDEAQEWWHEFNVKSNTTMRVRATCPKTGKVNAFKIFLRCLHQRRPEKSEKNEHSQKIKSTSLTKRNTNCPAGMIVAIRRHIKYSRSKMRDPVDPVHPCEIQIKFLHNHPTNSAASLRFRPVSKEVKFKLLNLYQIGHSPASALETLKMDLQVEHGSLYSEIISDRYHCPDKSFCYRLYYKHFGKNYASAAKTDVLSLVNEKVLHYNTIIGETCLAVGMCENEWAIAICTPLMKRAHYLPQSGDVVYIEVSESPGNKERSEHNVLLLIAHTAAGGIPLGAILSTSKSTGNLTHGFQLLKKLLPDHAFYCKGAIGPLAFLTDDSENQRVALNNVWSHSDVIICTFRLLQSTWKWLWDEKHNILKDHRLYLLYLLKTLLFASSETEMNNKYQSLCKDNVTIHYPMYLQHVKGLWERRHLWGLYFHRLLPLQDANNYFEAAVRTLKDKVFEVTKSFNLLQVLNYSVTRLDLYFKIKLLDILHSKTSHVFRSHFPDTIPSHIIQEIKLVAGNYFLVPSGLADGKMFTVDAELNTCSCPVGICGVLCLHQFWIFLKTNTEIFRVGFFDEELKQKLFVVATGAVSHNEIPHPKMPVEIPNSSLPEFPETECPVPSEANVLSEKFVLKEVNAEHCIGDITSAANVLENLQKNELLSLSSVNCAEVTSHSFINTLPDAVPDNSNCSDVNSCSEAAIKHNQNSDIKVCPTSSGKDDIEKQKETMIAHGKDDSDAEKRMAEVLEKFEDFCQRVRDGLKSHPKEFLPALEIMMKTLERKGYSSDIIVSGLSFFSVLSAPSLKSKGRKRASVADLVEREMVPKVHGRQMITYGRKRPFLSKASVSSKVNTVTLTKDHSQNEVIMQTPSENS